MTEQITAVERVSQELLSLPIDTLPYHEQLLHGKYTERHSHVAALQGRRTIQEWRETVGHQARVIEQLGWIATIVAHPLCMDITDHLHEFEQLCRFLWQYETRWASEMIHPGGKPTRALQLLNRDYAPKPNGRTSIQTRPHEQKLRGKI